MLQMLNVLEHFPISEMGSGSADKVHVMTEVMRLAYADRSKHLGDPEFYSVPVDWLTSEDYAAELADTIDYTSDVGFTNGVLTVFQPGVEPAGQQYSTILYVWTAADDTAGFKEFVAPFDLTGAFATTYELATFRLLSADVATNEQGWNGVVSITSNRLVRVTEGTIAPMVAGAVLKLEFFA